MVYEQLKAFNIAHHTALSALTNLCAEAVEALTTSMASNTTRAQELSGDLAGFHAHCFWQGIATAFSATDFKPMDALQPKADGFKSIFLDFPLDAIQSTGANREWCRTVADKRRKLLKDFRKERKKT